MVIDGTCNEGIQECLKQFHELCKEYGEQDFLQLYQRHVIPDFIKPSLLTKKHPIYEHIQYDDVENTAIALHGYSRITYVWVDVLIKEMERYFKKPRQEIHILEVCAGNGCFTYAMASRGLQCRATDDYSDDFSFKENFRWVEVERLGIMASLEKYGAWADVIYCGWPYANTPIGDVVQRMPTIKQDLILLYLGGIGCASDWFFHSASRVRSFHVGHTNRKYANFDIYHDKFCAYRALKLYTDTFSNKSEADEAFAKIFAEADAQHSEFQIYLPEWEDKKPIRLCRKLFYISTTRKAGCIEACKFRNDPNGDVIYLHAAVDPHYNNHALYIMRGMLRSILEEVYFMCQATYIGALKIVAVVNPLVETNDGDVKYTEMRNVMYEIRARKASIILPEKYQDNLKYLVNTPISTILPYHIPKTRYEME